MVDTNSQVEFYLDMFACTYHDVVSASLVSKRDKQRDIEEIRRRVALEGMSFLRKTLPRLGKIIDQSLGNGTTFKAVGFKTHPHTAIPKLFGGLLNVLFAADGRPRVAPSSASEQAALAASTPAPGSNARRPDTKLRAVDCLEAVDQNYSRETAVLALNALRQLCFMFYKQETPYSYEQENKVCEDFIKTDAELPDLKDLSKEVDVILCVARRLIKRVLANADPKSGIPRHGNGAVSTGEKPCEKHRFKRYYRALAREFPYDEWFFYNQSHLCDKLQEFLAAPEEEAGTAKVVLVPKDSRGPRLISCEPLEYQWIQQSLMRVLVDTLESHPLSRGQVNFTDQTINRRLALEGSQRGDTWVTLDMKDASDRVSSTIVEALFPEHWSRALMSARTTRTRLPNGQIVTLKKFAPMGSAVCFPVEALVFWATSVAALHIYTNTPLETAATKVFVYGDDIICDKVHHSIIGCALESLGLKLNDTKCCVSGFFRESCGMDAFYGHPVIPVRVRKTFSHRRDGALLSSYVALHNAMYEKGCVLTADYILWNLQNIWNWTIPVVSSTGSSGLDLDPARNITFVRHDASVISKMTKCKTRFNRALQRREIKGYRLRGTTTQLPSNCWGQMLENFSRTVNCTTSVVQVTTRRPKAPTIEYPIAHRNILSRAWSPID